MAVYLNEEHLGFDDDVVGFPHLLLCLGVVVVIGGRMYGVHLTHPKYTDDAVKAFRKFLTEQKVSAANTDALYGSGNFLVRYGKGGVRAWQNEMDQIAGLIGFKGEGRGLNTQIISPKNGTYVEYCPAKLAGACKIFYKRHEKMDYGTNAMNKQVFKITASGALLPNLMMSPTSATGKTSLTHKGTMHEVDYAHNLHKVQL